MMMMMMMMICGLGLALATSMHAQLFRPSERSVKLCCPRIDRHEGQRMLESFNCPGLACLHWIRPRTRGRIPGCALTPRIPSCRLDKATIRPNLRFWPYPRPRRAEPACPKLEPLLPPPRNCLGAPWTGSHRRPVRGPPGRGRRCPAVARPARHPAPQLAHQERLGRGRRHLSRLQ
jgi:hypothetical protein